MLWHNVRSSRQTELSEIFPSHVVRRWLGNSVRVVEDHHLQVTDDPFNRVVAAPAGGVAQNAARSVQSSECQTVSAEMSANKNPPY